ncbi:efflux RND transporter periplasmic adaptor subunit [Gloeothece verrucosa]|uniref:Efflux transporter, RND family, MFP subunit n=1 Tax=Gloeothece verrucosa (strain PCC 7822) TaxID=497965 RepID=E0UCA1_GLOV7|nr:efflux RND transporter periplasmic adaptor subunit [Gloeothece verrucosa]ADN12858.1 efflux transporter, RND family, MFP subunit [Gloeothece verrucosa PCC 7822]
MNQNNILISRQLVGTMVVLSLFTTACAKEQETATAPKAIPVKLQTLESATLIDSTQYVGYLESQSRVALAPKTEGRIIRLFVKEGDQVSKGQKIAQLEPTKQEEDVNSAASTVQSRIAALTQAQADFRQTQAQRDSAKADIARFQADLANAEANARSKEADLQRATAEEDLAKINYGRAEFLVKEGVQPQQDLDNNTRNLNTAKANVESARKIRDAALASVQAAEGALQAAINNLQAANERVKAAQSVVKQAQANIGEAQGQLGSINQNLIYNTVFAPIDGFVGDFNQKKNGDYIKTGEELTTITDNKVFLLNINIPTEHYNRLRIGLPVQLINADGTPRIKGEVSFISPLANENAQAILVKVTFRNDGSLRNNQYVRAKVIWDQKPGVLVPTTAVTKLGGQSFVFVAENADTKDGKTSLVAKQKPITVGTIQGQAYQVLGGVNVGDKIAVSRILDLKDNTPISTETLESQKVQ